MSATILPFAPNDPAFQRINPASLSAEWCTNGVEAPAPWGAPKKVRDVYAKTPHDKQIECRWLDYNWGKPLKVIRGAVNGTPAGWFIEEPGWLQQDRGSSTSCNVASTLRPRPNFSCRDSTSILTCSKAEPI